MSLEEAARQRKERLKAMKRKMDTGEADSTETTQSTEELSNPVFRNYVPHDNKLKESQLPRGVPEQVEAELSEQLEATQDTTVVDEIVSLIAKFGPWAGPAPCKITPNRVILDLTKLAPRKIDWDLKRDCSKKLEKLERRTQRAIAELIRERLTSGDKDTLLVSAVNSSAQASEQGHASDDDDTF